MARAAGGRSPRSGRRRRRIPLLGWLFGILGIAALLGVAAGATVLFARAELSAVSSTSDGNVEITVHPGETVDQLAQDLSAHHLIRSVFWFDQYARIKNLQSKLRPGVYTLDDSMSVNDIDNRLVQPPDKAIVTVTIPEGFTASQIAALLQAKLKINAADYMNAVTRGTFTEPFLQQRPAGASLEGFLFPDTYDFAQGISAHDVVQEQLDTFAAKAEPLLAARMPAGQTAYGVLTIASIIEKEAKFAADRPQVASVIYNRLAQKMMLQVDATVLYGLNESGTGQQPTAAQLQQPGPYNTYLDPGLPPTPISNPGVAAITAAVHPASTQYLYYVSDGCGHNHYSVDLATHQQQLAQYVGKPCGS